MRLKAAAPGVRTLELVRAGIDDRPQVGAVLHPLHLRGEPAVTRDPVLGRLRVVAHQVLGPRIAHHLHAEQLGVGLMEAETRFRRHADAVERHDPEQQRAGGVADAVDDHALAAIADLGILRFVSVDVAAVVARDAVIRCGRRGRQNQEKSRQTPHEPPDCVRAGYLVAHRCGKTLIARELSPLHWDSVKPRATLTPYYLAVGRRRFTIIRGSAGLNSTGAFREMQVTYAAPISLN